VPAIAASLALQGACDSSSSLGCSGGPVYVAVHNERPASHYEPWAACHRVAGAGLLWEDARASLASGGVVSSIPAMMASQKQRAENVR
jgi:hypothetical protein